MADIDWIRVLFHALWITGGALILAGLGLRHFLSRQNKTPFLSSLRSPRLPFGIPAGLGLGFLGAGWVAASIWLKVLLWSLGAGLAAFLWLKFGTGRKEKERP